MNFGSDSKFMRFRGSCESSRFCEMLGIAHIVRRQVSSFYLPTLSFNLTPSLVSPSHPSDPRLAAVLPSGNRSAMDHEDDDPGLAGLSPEFQAMLGGMAGHSASFAKLMEKRTLSKQEEKAKDAAHQKDAQSARKNDENDGRFDLLYPVTKNILFQESVGFPWPG